MYFSMKYGFDYISFLVIFMVVFIITDSMADEGLPITL